MRLTVDEVVAELVDVRKTISALQEAEYILSRQIIEAMEEDGSERMRTPAGIVTIPKSVTYDAAILAGLREITIPKSVTYDAAILAGLREITDPEDLAGIYYPEHEEVRQVPERWNMSKGRKLVKHSGEHAAIIEDAKIYGRPKVKIEEATSGS